ncbi:hypothetical protein EYF80_036920 [Liparis tanakae]|uniref:Uncharacterized protein n=1 Tax=Liparis tanakae TaxID=230148 RepID=A0A4Z2GH79_9TELE|nr:hypothetical protein EYF80_036920 [Liparis tanakae]
MNRIQYCEEISGSTSNEHPVELLKPAALNHFGRERGVIAPLQHAVNPQANPVRQQLAEWQSALVAVKRRFTLEITVCTSGIVDESIQTKAA